MMVQYTLEMYVIFTAAPQHSKRSKMYVIFTAAPQHSKRSKMYVIFTVRAMA